MRPAVPTKPLELEEAIARWPTIRQSWASNFDDCPLSSWLTLKYAHGWSTTPQARGTIFHRTAAEILRTMQREGATTIPRHEALAILVEVCYQRDVPPDEIVRVPLRQMPELRMAVDKFAKDNEFSVHKIVDIERQLRATIRYPHPAGGHVERELTGTMDALLFAPPSEAIVIDWKDTFGLPPEPKEELRRGYDDEELSGLSFHGYFQQRWYGFLVLNTYRNIDKVTLREFYPRKTKVRAATLHRHQLPEVEEELGILIASMDAALMQGPPDLSLDAEGYVDMDRLGWWTPQPGRHCGFCVRPTSCPIEEHVRIASGGAAASEEEAAGWAARAQIATRIREMAIDAMKGYVEMGGGPIPTKWSKGRLVWGWYKTKRGRRFGQYVPDASDRGGHADVDQQLIEAMKSATERARAERGIKPRQPRRRQKARA